LKEIQSLFTKSKYLEEVKIPNAGDVTNKAWKSVMPPSNAQDPGRPNVCLYILLIPPLPSPAFSMGLQQTKAKDY
jgi:phage tail sheath gpL-like